MSVLRLERPGRGRPFPRFLKTRDRTFASVNVNTEIESLVYLLEDPDPRIQKQIEARLLEWGERAIPQLDQARVQSDNRGEREAIVRILHRITFSSLMEEFANLAHQGIQGRARLESALFLLARFGNPTLDEGYHRRRLNRMAQEVASRLTPGETEGRKMHTLLQYLFGELQFKGETHDYHSVESAYLDRVLDRRRGMPVMLGSIVLFLARRLNLPFYGVNMPVHFMLIYQGTTRELMIDPFDGGRVVSYDQCHFFLKKNGIQPRPEHFQRCSSEEIVVRCLRNLIYSYSRRKEEDRVSDLNILMELIRPDSGSGEINT